MKVVGQQLSASGLVLTANYQAGTELAPYGSNPSGGAWRSVALYTKYIKGSATGQARIRVRWIPQRNNIIISAIPAVGFEIDLPTDFEIVVNETFSVVSVEAPGGAASAVVFDYKEIGDVGNPGTIESSRVEGVAL